MAQRPATAPPEGDDVRILDGSFRLVVLLAAVLMVGMVARLVLGPVSGPGSAASPGASSSASSAAPGPPASVATVDVASFLYPAPGPAPSIELTDPNDRAFSLVSLRGEPVLVFFGYTHCPDICPATIGTVGLAMDAFGPGVAAVFVSVDPERDTTTWLKEYVRFLPAGFTALTGSLDAIKSTADAWGVKYAKVETGVADAYSMSHTAEVYLVDADGVLRAHFPFGTESEVMTAVLREVVATAPSAASATPPASAAPITTASPATSATPVESIDVDVVSTSVWAGAPGPVILDLLADGARLDDPTL
ncbi:MAG TPA: SCO family protein, partial [Candidatus Limnocylindrales bacterium]|nr:SCO family protein [Candidatus Limnocylindrales bacterium]